MNRTQKKAMKKHQEVQRARMEATEAFVAQLARDLYVRVAYEFLRDGVSPEQATRIAHACMEAAVTYFDALQTFRKPAPPNPDVLDIEQIIEEELSP